MYLKRWRIDTVVFGFGIWRKANNSPISVRRLVYFDDEMDGSYR